MEKLYVQEAFDTNWIAPLGPHVNKFEKEISNYIGNVETAVLSSGTAALHLALILLGVQRDDEVIAQSFTFCGSVNPITYLGARPVLVDSEQDTWNMDPLLLEKAILDLTGRSKKPKAVIYVHLYGMPAKINEIRDITGKYEIPLIEDAAEALGSRYALTPVGQFGDFSILSFNGNKIITTGGGGALLSPDEEKIKKARFLATQARDPALHYEHSEIGYNYRLSNVSAAIGRGQLASLEEKMNRRRKIYEIYREELSGYSFLRFPEELPSSISNRWLTCMTMDHPDIGPIDLVNILEKDNIESRPFWKPMHIQPVYKNVRAYTNGVSVDLFRRGICLPSGSGMTDHDLDRVITRIREFLDNK
jgi:dTDP-4-amino-4,6-dideoxygalactose transaminase